MKAGAEQRMVIDDEDFHDVPPTWLPAPCSQSSGPGLAVQFGCSPENDCGPCYVRAKAGGNCPLVQRSETVRHTLGPLGVWRASGGSGRAIKSPQLRFPREKR